MDLWIILKLEITSMKDKFKRIDIPGTILVGSSTCFFFGLTAGGVLFEWGSANVHRPLVQGCGRWRRGWKGKEIQPGHVKLERERSGLSSCFSTNWRNKGENKLELPERGLHWWTLQCTDDIIQWDLATYSYTEALQIQRIQNSDHFKSTWLSQIA